MKQSSFKILAALAFLLFALVSRLPHHLQRELLEKAHAVRSAAEIREPGIPRGEALTGEEVFWPGLPSVQEEEEVIVLKRIGYTVGYSTSVHCPRWTAYAIKGVYNPSSAARPEGFSPDPEIPFGDQVQTAEYNHSGFDRGHMAPSFAVSFSYGRAAQIETFYTTNICPQRPECNRHIWEDLERIEGTDYARRYDGVVTFDGPVFKDSSGNEARGGIGYHERIRIPLAFYKIIVRRYKGQIGVIAFIIPQVPEGHGRDGLQKYLVSVNEIEARTGIRFLTALPMEQQAALKASPMLRLW